MVRLKAVLASASLMFLLGSGLMEGVGGGMGLDMGSGIGSGVDMGSECFGMDGGVGMLGMGSVLTLDMGMVLGSECNFEPIWRKEMLTLWRWRNSHDQRQR